jgi:ferredoxin--NADP+ reductase
LAYHDYITSELPQHEFLGEMVRNQLKYYPTVTREPFQTQGRIPDLIENGQMARDLGVPELNRDTDRAMLCGSPQMLKSIKEVLEKRGFKEGNTTTPGDFVVERAFVDQ